VTKVDARRFYKSVPLSGEVARLCAAVMVALSAGACSMTFPMASLVSEEPQATQSVAPRIVSPLSPELGEEDWRRARAAMAVALDPQGTGSKVSWDNPDTAMKGHFTPVGQPYVRSDEICREFLATIVGQASTSNLQGTACRPSGDDWAVKDVKPANKA
jgi:surface antigen